MSEDKIAESFRRIKEDMNFFQQEIQQIKANQEQTEISFNLIKRTLEDLDTKIKLLAISSNTKEPNSITPTHIPTHPYHQEALKSSNMPISTGNDGVPTHHPTLHPTNQHIFQHPPISTEETQKNVNFQENSTENHTGNQQFSLKNSQNSEKTPKIDKISRIQQVSDILNSLDELKKEVRFKFKKLTNQEMLIYSTIYQLEELGLEVDYSIVADKLNLTPISIRDYVRKIISKGVPLDKSKENNKRILLKIPNNFKKVATLNTILELREL